MSDLSTSLKEIFNERISSPFYGSLIVSWLLWNCEIPYVTFFVDQDRLGDSINKIEYISKHCGDWLHLAVYPILSTAFILFIVPYATNYAYYKTAQFDRWRKDKQIEIDRSQVLTVEQSLKILSDAQKQEENFKNLLTSRDEQIKSLIQQLEHANQQLNFDKQKKTKEAIPSRNNEQLFLSEDLTEFFNNRALVEDFEQITDNIERGYHNQDIKTTSLKYCVVYGLIEPDSSGVNGYYRLTAKGKMFLKELMKQKSNNKNI